MVNIKRGFVIVKADELRIACGDHAKRNNTNYSAVCTLNGLSNGYISNSKDAYVRYCINNGKERSEIDFSLGIMNELIFSDICKAFELDKNNFLLNVKEEVVEELTEENTDVVTTDYSEKIEDIQKVLSTQIYLLTEISKSLDSLGKVSVQNMEYLKKLVENL